MFPEDHEGRGLSAIMDKVRPANATRASPAVSKDSGSLVEERDPQRLE